MIETELVTRRLINRAEYHRMVEVGLLDEDDHIELIDGEIFEMAPIGSEHGSRTARLNHLMSLALGNRAIVVEQHAIRLGDMSEPEPDLVVIDRAWNFNPASHPTAGEILLIVEVAQSSLRHDRDRKVPLYARYGIPEVWLIDLGAQALTVYREPVDGQYVQARTLTSGTLAPAAFPDVRLDVANLI